MRSRTIEYKIDERFLKRFVGSISKWQVVDDVELMISVRSEMLKQEKEEDIIKMAIYKNLIRNIEIDLTNYQ